MNSMQKRAVTPDARRAWMHCEGKNARDWVAYNLDAGAQRCDWLPAFHHKYQDYAAWLLSHGQSGYFPHMQDLACVTMRLAAMVEKSHLMAWLMVVPLTDDLRHQILEYLER